jgi:hypothetical protein
MPTTQREDTWLVVLNVGGVDCGTWDTYDGGETDSEESVFRPGGMDQQISLGGRQTYGNVTMSRHQDDWLRGRVKWLRNQCGRTRVTIGRVPLDYYGLQLGPVEWLGGTLKTVTPPSHDSMGSDASMVEIECTIDTVA